MKKWKIVEVKENNLENKLNALAKKGYEIFKIEEGRKSFPYEFKIITCYKLPKLVGNKK